MSWKREYSDNRRARARALRALLFNILGHECVMHGQQGAGKCKGPLTFDCIEAKGDAHHKMNSVNAAQFYLKQASAGNLQVLCKKHNDKKGDGPF